MTFKKPLKGLWGACACSCEMHTLAYISAVNAHAHAHTPHSSLCRCLFMHTCISPGIVIASRFFLQREMKLTRQLKSASRRLISIISSPASLLTEWIVQDFPFLCFLLPFLHFHFSFPRTEQKQPGDGAFLLLQDQCGSNSYFASERWRIDTISRCSGGSAFKIYCFHFAFIHSLWFPLPSSPGTSPFLNPSPACTRHFGEEQSYGNCLQIFRAVEQRGDWRPTMPERIKRAALVAGKTHGFTLTADMCQWVGCALPVLEHLGKVLGIRWERSRKLQQFVHNQDRNALVFFTTFLSHMVQSRKVCWLFVILLVLVLISLVEQE